MQRFTHVDLIRGLSALLVIFSHYHWMYADGVGHVAGYSDRVLPLYSLLRPLYSNGWMAVQMFWTLSGFVFMVAYADRTPSIRDFAVWRLSRLYPLHFVTLLLVAAIQAYSLYHLGKFQFYRYNDLHHFILNLLFISGWAAPQNQWSFNAPIWSVSVEILLYAVFLFYLKCVPVRLWTAALVAAAFLAGAAVADNAVISCGRFFFMGVLVYWPAQWLGGRKDGVRSAAGILAASFLLSWFGGERVFISLVLPALLLFAAVADYRRRPVPKQWRWIGDITYSTYLLHMPIIMVCVIVMRTIGATPHWTMLPGLLALVTGLSWLVYRYFEKPTQDRIRKLFGGRAKEPATVAPTI